MVDFFITIHPFDFDRNLFNFFFRCFHKESSIVLKMSNDRLQYVRLLDLTFEMVWKTDENHCSLYTVLENLLNP